MKLTFYGTTQKDSQVHTAIPSETCFIMQLTVAFFKESQKHEYLLIICDVPITMLNVLYPLSYFILKPNL